MVVVLGIFNLNNSQMGIDLGTSSILVMLKDRGIVYNEPTVIAVNNLTNEVIAIGREAKDMLGKNPKEIEDIKNNKIAIYTAFTGDYDTLKHPEVIDENCDYICFTDNAELTSDLWKIIPMEESILDNNRKAKKTP